MNSRVSWSDLPQELVSKIAEHLESRTEIKNFRAVCHTWLSSCPLSSKLLSLLLPHEISAPRDEYFVGLGERLVLVASNIYVLHPPQIQNQQRQQDSPRPWMVRVEELHPGSLQIQRPLTHNWNIDLPDSFPRGLNLSKIRVTEVFKGYNLSRESSNNQSVMSRVDVNKVVLYSHPQGNSPVTVGDFTAVVLFLDGPLYAVRLSDNHWQPIKFGRVSRFDDVLNFKGKIVVLDRKGRLYRLCCLTLTHICIVPHSLPINPAVETRKHLAELCGELYVVHCFKHHFKVFKLIEEQRPWDEVSNVGDDRLLFVGPDCCFFALVDDFPDWKGNSIVYHMDSFLTYRRNGRVFYSMFDNPNQYLYFGIYDMGDDRSVYISARPAYSDVLWPPPLWLRHPDHRPTATARLEALPEEASETNAAMVV